MGVETMAATHEPVYSALLNLERSSASPIELLGEASSILGISFSDIQHDILFITRRESAEVFPLFAPKEEWALRWLLKKTGPTPSSASQDAPSTPCPNVDPRKWLLFCHLVPRVPAKRLAKIMRDYDGVSQMRHALIHLSTGPSAQPSLKSLSGGQSPPRCDSETVDYEVPQGKTKKRKRSSKPKDFPDLPSARMQVLTSILVSLQICVDYLLSSSIADVSAQNQLRVALTLAPEVAASILQHLFQVALHVNQTKPEGFSMHFILDLLQKSLHLWDFRRGLDLGHTAEESDQAFTSHLLPVCLSLIRHIRMGKIQQRHRDLESQSETLVASHSLQPARKVFFDESRITWKSDSDPLLVEHIQPAVRRLQSLLFESGGLEGESNAASQKICSRLGPLATILLEIGIRSSPRSTVLKIQHEKPWLEALFVCLAHVEGCSLLNNTDRIPETSEQEGRNNLLIVPSAGEASLTCLETLLGTLLEWESSLSLPLIASLAQHFSGLSLIRSTRWSLIEKIMELDINVFLPNSGISNAEGLLDSLIERLDSASDPPGSDRPTRLKILCMLMKGFASARDLAGFVDVWMGRLAALEDRRKTDVENIELEQSSSLWEDEDVIEEFSRIARLSATPYLVESHLTATTEALRDEKYNGRHYGLVIVLDLLIATHEEDTKSAQHTMELLSAQLQETVPAFKTSGRLKAWLWRLLRHVTPLVSKNPSFAPFENLIQGKEPPIFEIAAQHVGSPIACFAEVERFHCFISVVDDHLSAVTKHLSIEIEALTQHVDNAATTNGNEGPDLLLWDGRVTSLKSSSVLVTAFLGILLRRAEVLSLSTNGTIDLLKALVRHPVGEDLSTQKSPSGFATLFEAVVMNQSLVNNPGFVRMCIKATALMDEAVGDKNLKILQALPKEAMNKWQRRQIGEWLERKRGTQQTQIDNEDFRAASIDSGDSKCFKGGIRMTSRDLQSGCREALISLNSLNTNKSDTMRDLINAELCPTAKDLVRLGSSLYRAEASPLVTQTGSTLLTLLPKSRSVDEFCLIVDCVKIILERIPPAVNQWTVDNLLACVAVALSSQGPAISNAAFVIFERLCRLVGVLLSRHRIRLGGRYHLLLPVLQALLRCLFVSDPHSLTTQSQLLFRSKLPPWILSASTARLNKTSATRLGRLLSSICDPTPSSVRTSRGPRSELNDETKKAKRIAGEYMQYFIAEYTYCQLNGSIEPDSKQGLMPGLYVTMDAMGSKVMRAMNAAMDSNQRAIWKALYEDWSKFGKWNGM